MYTIYNFIMNNFYLYICIIICLTILATILVIVSGNKKGRKKIKDDFIEAEKVEAEVESIDKGENNAVLEDIIQKMQADMEVKPEEVVKRFEQEQEENAIISYQELIDNVKAGKIETIEDEQSDIDFVEAISGDEVSEPVLMSVNEDKEGTVTPDMVKDAIESISKDSIKASETNIKKFKQSSFISPVFGIIDDNKLEYPTVKKRETILDIMNTRDYNELTEEIKKQEEFLQALKEFRNNL